LGGNNLKSELALPENFDELYNNILDMIVSTKTRDPYRAIFDSDASERTLGS
jgi:hypothetical protein